MLKHEFKKVNEDNFSDLEAILKRKEIEYKVI